MGCRPYRGLAVAFALLAAASPALAEDDVSPRVKKAHEAARANALSPEGHEWKRNNSHATDRLMILVLNRCLPDPPGDVPTAFPVYLRFSRAGGVRELITEIDPSLERCMAKVAHELPFPEAPRDDYWVQVNMAAPF